MRFILKGPFKDNIYNLMRKAGYHFQSKFADERSLSTLVFSRPARGYPRLHIYLEVKDNNLIINLHLDQKKPIYKGTTAHSGDYQGKVVEEEAERIKQILRD